MLQKSVGRRSPQVHATLGVRRGDSDADDGGSNKQGHQVACGAGQRLGSTRVREFSDTV